MGNQPSSEKSGRISQKPPPSRAVGIDVKPAAVSTASPPRPNDTNHYSNSYLTDPPTHSDLRSSQQAKPRLKDQPTPHLQGGRDGLSIDNARRRSGIDQFAALSHPRDGSAQHQSAIGFRTKDATDGSIAISGNFPTAMRGQYRPWNPSERNRSAQNETACSDSLPEQINLENKTSAYNRNTRERLARGHHPQGSLDRPVGRTQSDASLYIPIRRRSTTETPGVATRLEAPIKAPTKKQNSRSSLPPAFSSFKTEEYANSVKRRLSTPPPFTRPENPILVETPSEAEYKQLGVMKFGSLRIINGTPGSTPAGVVSNSATSSEGGQDDYFQQHLRPRLVDINTKSVNSKQTREEPMRRQASTAKKERSLKSTNDAEALANIPARPNSDSWPMVPGSSPKDEKPAKSSNDSSSLVTMSARNGQQNSGPRVSRADSGVSLKHSPIRPDAHMQHADSGYSSSISLRSIFGSKKKRDRELEQRAVEKEKTEQTRTRRDEVQCAPSAQQAARVAPPSQTALEKPTLGTDKVHHGGAEGHKSNVNSQATPPAVALSSKFSVQRSRSNSARPADFKTQAGTEELIPGRPRELSSSNSRGRLRADSTSSVQAVYERNPKATQPSQAQQISQDTPVRTRSNSTRSGEMAFSKNLTEEGSGLPKPSKLERLFAGRRRSLPDVRPTQMTKSAAPPMPSDAQEKLREHGSTVSRKGVDQKRPVESRQKDSGASKGSHLSRAASILVPKSKSKPTDKRRLSKQSKHDDDVDSESLLGYEVQVASLASIRNSAGNSAFDQAFVSMSIEYSGHGGHERMGPANNPHDSKHTKQPQLRTRRSAPEFLETVRESASMNDIGSPLEWFKAPPPVSLHTRGKKKKRSKRHTSSRSTHFRNEQGPVPPLPPAMSNGQVGNESDAHRQYLSHSLRTIPIASAQWHGREEVSQGAQERASSRHKSMPSNGSSHSSKPRPYFPIPGLDPPSQLHGQCSSDANTNDGPQGQVVENRADAPPYRVLHSYNSPSYRGVPIWSS